MKKRVIVFLAFLTLLVVLQRVYSVETTTLTIFEEGEQATGFKFRGKSFTSSNDADIYVKKTFTGEATEFFFFANRDNFINVGRENLDEFGCGGFSLEDYSSETKIYERQGYCVLTYDREETFKIYVSSISEDVNSVEISWTIHAPTESDESLSGEEGVAVPVIADEEGSEESEEGGSEGGAAAGIRKDIVPEIPSEEEKEEGAEQEDKLLDKIAKFVKWVFNQLTKNPMVAVIAVLIIVALFSGYITYQRRKKSGKSLI